MKTNPKIKLDGVLILDKAVGVSSNRALQQVKHLYTAQKAGHTGSLDPLASGVLPICFGEATKFSRFLLDADKTYLVTAQLGVITDSGDSEGNIIAEHPVPTFTREHLLSHIVKFLGATKQVPSMYSALKQNGQPLYKLARQNITVERAARDIIVYSYELLSFDAEQITCKIHCSKGTYIRTLIEDLGLSLGCGAHVTALRRIQAGPFTIENSISYAQLELMDNKDHLILPPDCLLYGLTKVVLSAVETAAIRNGIQIKNQTAAQGIICLLTPEQELLGIGEARNDGNIAVVRLVATRLLS